MIREFRNWRKGSAGGLIEMIILGFLGVLAVDAAADLSNLHPVGHHSTVILFLTGAVVFGTIWGLAEAAA